MPTRHIYHPDDMSRTEMAITGEQAASILWAMSAETEDVTLHVLGDNLQAAGDPASPETTAYEIAMDTYNTLREALSGDIGDRKVANQPIVLDAQRLQVACGPSTLLIRLCPRERGTGESQAFKIALSQDNCLDAFRKAAERIGYSVY